MPSRKRLKESEDRERCIHKSEGKLHRKIKALQIDLTDLVLSFFLNEITFEKGKIISTPSNLAKVARLERVFQNWVALNMSDVLKIVVGGVKQLHKDNEAYFTKIVGKSIANESKRILNILSARLGIKDDGDLVRDGYMETVLTSHGDSVIELKDELLRSIITERTVVNFKEDISNRIKGNPDQDGILEKHFDRHLTDVWQQYDREAGRQFANKLGLKYAIYQGGLIQTSRPFCRVRNNLVFTSEEIAKFGTSKDKYGGYSNKSTGDFQGKPDIYNPFLDLGGYNCRHLLDYVSNELGEYLKNQQSNP